MSNLDLKVEDVGNGCTRVLLRGVIDETAEFRDLLDRAEGAVLLDTREVERITSPGVVRWVRAMGTLTASHDVTIEAVSHALATNALSIAGMFPGCKILSCVAPYFCPHCRSDFDLVVAAHEVGPDGTPPRKRCPECRGDLDFDELDEFLSFMLERT